MGEEVIPSLSQRLGVLLDYSLDICKLCSTEPNALAQSDRIEPNLECDVQPHALLSNGLRLSRAAAFVYSQTQFYLKRPASLVVEASG